MPEGATEVRYDEVFVAAVGVLNTRWALHVVHALSAGPLGFNELRRQVPGPGPSTLKQRLSELADAGLVRREVLDGSPPRTRYSLTGRGAGLRPMFAEMTAWATRNGLRPTEPGEVSGGVLGLFQEKWAIHVVCVLLTGPRGFNELAREVGISQVTLSQRLSELERRGLVDHDRGGRPATYSLSRAGLDFRVVAEPLVAWAHALHAHQERPAAHG
ncbi:MULTISPECIES: helix-turn-helix domain-containing protein [Saccharopolyspora]|uniref:HTH hxlR-type domain-containing protein n=1 Tax=Saccharopolyspora gregorii TaxID=33914 RepID=A0ABP6RRN3_9PSEU|nr:MULTISPECIES: helix-turn-helix domain-containing protein [Saccharopolyspora]MCA1190189.1 helix-turn-helix transcriptional regulator [Saccharopolyspora sp. 6T]MCA1193057.1 helix-turn-helix transcriptional regulator [Saccharopolyspora sp. 6V]MCA1229562.1 helix-turn-helix transcriptional regulator [Saccharopolyspora sp. 6M]MCA1283418.1 helix-turn-helix transcriptional regulator [Saccharopolyspora sp. 7B]